MFACCPWLLVFFPLVLTLQTESVELGSMFLSQANSRNEPYHQKMRIEIQPWLSVLPPSVPYGCISASYFLVWFRKVVMDMDTTATPLRLIIPPP